MSEGFKESNSIPRGLKENGIEGVLKGLQGKTLTKKSIFDILLGINVNELPASKVITQESEPVKKAVKEKKKREKHNKQEELSKFFDLITNTIVNPKVQEQEQEQKEKEKEDKYISDIESTYPCIELDVDTLFEPDSIPKTIIIPVPIPEHKPILDSESDSDEEVEEKQEDIYDDISVILYPMGIKRPIVTKPKEPVELICKACKKTFTVESSLKRHYKRYPECLDFMALPNSTNNVNIERGLHFIIDELLCKATCLNGEKVCRWCKTKYMNIGNLHKHLNTSKVCNNLAFQELKRLILNLEV